MLEKGALQIANLIGSEGCSTWGPFSQECNIHDSLQSQEQCTERIGGGCDKMCLVDAVHMIIEFEFRYMIIEI